jgi:hypothetical protein
VERECFPVIPEEIRIIKPNVIVFLTGPNYDNVIGDNFGKVSYSDVPSFTQQRLAKVSIPDVDFAFRTYHPGYLWRHNIEEYFHAIISGINL